MKRRGWVCAQQGAREHYTIPRALAAAGRLVCFVTDAWSEADSWIARIPFRPFRRLAGRHHPDIPPGVIRSHTLRFSLADAIQRVYQRDEAVFHAARNAAFDRLAVRDLVRHLQIQPGPAPIVFAYAHACRNLFRAARAAGCPTILGQFDPGPLEADIVEEEGRSRPEFVTRWQRYPDDYVDRWREEIQLTEVVLANSAWSAQCLEKAGVEAARIRIVPLVYTSRNACEPRRYPAAFTRQRPLIVLFLGQIILRKGIARLIDAAKRLQNEPLEFRLVGPTDIENLSDLIRGLPIHWLGPVARHEVDAQYAAADVFILPTLSDGFALTQLEAMSWRLPVIASRRCGAVVRPEVDGFMLAEPTADEIVRVLHQCLTTPSLLAEMSAHSSVQGFGLDRLTRELLGLLPDSQ